MKSKAQNSSSGITGEVIFAEVCSHVAAQLLPRLRVCSKLHMSPFRRSATDGPGCKDLVHPLQGYYYELSNTKLEQDPSSETPPRICTKLFRPCPQLLGLSKTAWAGSAPENCFRDGGATGGQLAGADTGLHWQCSFMGFLNLRRVVLCSVDDYMIISCNLARQGCVPRGCFGTLGKS